MPYRTPGKPDPKAVAEEALGRALGRALAALRTSGREKAAERIESATSYMDIALALTEAAAVHPPTYHPPPLEEAILTLVKAYWVLARDGTRYVHAEMFAEAAIDRFDDLEHPPDERT